MGFTQYSLMPVLSRYVVDQNGCWIYQGEIAHNGYGVVQTGQARTGNRKRCGAHRYFYEHMVATIPDGAYLCHKCDVPQCVNPKHMFVGDQKDNIRDMHQKKRGRTGCKGNKNHFCRISEKTVLEIRAAQGTQKEIANKFSVSQALVSYIKTRKLWAHI